MLSLDDMDEWKKEDPDQRLLARSNRTGEGDDECQSLLLSLLFPPVLCLVQSAARSQEIVRESLFKSADGKNSCHDKLFLLD